MTDLRLLQAISGGEQGGAEAFFVRLVLALERAGVSQRILVRSGRAWISALRERDLDLVELPFGGWADFTTKRTFAREVKNFRPHIALTWMNRASRLCPPQVLEHDFCHVARLGGYYDLKYYRNCDHLVGNTEDIVSYLRDQGWPTEKCHYLPNFVSAETKQAVERKALKTPESVPLLLALGRLHRNKAFDVLLRALAELPEAHLWLAGSGPEEHTLKSLAAKLGVASRLHLLGWREDVAALLAAADILVCPSRIEPLGNVVIEAWAQGTPVVASAAVGPMNLIVPGENGLIVPLEDASALALSVRTLIDNPLLAKRLSEAGRTVYEERYAEKVVVQRYLKFFQSVRS